MYLEDSNMLNKGQCPWFKFYFLKKSGCVTKKEGSNNNTTPLSNSLRQNVVGYLSIKPAA